MLSKNYKPEIDGLRAIAVIAVIINHFNEKLLPSGFLGVDIFFVISGYVITSSLANREQKSLGDFLLGFYSRRIKRLVPALITCILVTSIVGCLFIPPNAMEYGASGKTGIFALFGFSNLYLFKLSTDYFASSTALNLFTHTWSLGVEEQFYLLFPLSMWATGYLRNPATGKRKFIFLMILLSSLSLCTYVWLCERNPSAAFFLMPSRFWEFGIGCITFLWFPPEKKLPHYFSFANPLFIFALLIVILCLYQHAIYQSTIAIVTITSILIVTITPNSILYRTLTCKPVTFIGLISYSLYLWHWSVLAISRWTIGIYWWTSPIQLGLIIVLALISYKYIEKPLREITWSISRIKSLSYGIAAIVVSSIIVFGIAKIFKERLYVGKMDTLFINNQINRGSIKGTSINQQNCSWFLGKGSALAKSIPLCTLSSKNTKSQQRIIVLGDSHAGHLVGLLKHLYFDANLSIRLLYVHSQAVPMYISKERQEDRDIQQLIIDKTLADLHPGDIVVLSSYFPGMFAPRKENVQAINYKVFLDKYGKFTSQDTAFAKWVESLDNFTKSAKHKQAKVVFFAPTPNFNEVETYPFEACVTQWFRPKLSDNCKLSTDREELRLRNEHFMLNIELVKDNNNNFFIYDPFPILCPVGTTCSNYRNEVRVYFDNHHLNNVGGEYLYPDFIRFLAINKISSLENVQKYREGSK